jgi:hypothetical protein
MSPKLPEPARSADAMLPKPLREWIGRHLTVQNTLMALVLAAQGLAQGGHYLPAIAGDATPDAIEVRLQAAEKKAIELEAMADRTYMRKDVIDATLKTIDVRLAAIEQLLRDQRKD